MASAKAGSPMSASKTKQERIRDNQRRSRARRQDYIADLERRLRENHPTCRDADLQRTAYLDLQRENDHLRNLLVMAGVTSEAVDTFMRQNANQQAQPGDRASIPGRHLKPKLHILPSQASEPSRSCSDESSATSVDTFAVPYVQALMSVVGMTAADGLSSESDLCSVDGALWSCDDDSFSAAAQANLNRLFDLRNPCDHTPIPESDLLYSNPTFIPATGTVLESLEVPCSARWLRT